MNNSKHNLIFNFIPLSILFFIFASLLSFGEVEVILGENKSFVSESTDLVVIPNGINPNNYQPLSGAIAISDQQATELKSKYDKKKIDLIEILLKAEKGNEPNFDNIFTQDYTRPQVTSFLNQLSTKNNKRISLARERLKEYEPLFQKIFKEEGVPLELISMGFVESTYNKDAISKAGARGIWQFIPSTGKIFGLKEADDFQDPTLSTRAAAKYLKTLNKRFNNWLLVIAAYNAGETRVQYAINQARGSKNFWEISAHLPRETQNYVPHVVAATAILFQDNELTKKQ